MTLFASASQAKWLQGIVSKWKSASDSASTGPSLCKKPVFTLVPSQLPIELVAYYAEFEDYYPECELQTKRWFVENMGRDWVCFDVGANIGYYSVLFSRLAPEGKIYAFEPTDTIDMLRTNIAHHKVGNVEPMKVALGEVCGRHAEDVFRIWGRPAERKEYDFETVDNVVHKLRLDRLDCLKIDVDSFDFEVLRGAQRTLERFNPWIVVELNHALAKRNQSVNEALQWLLGRGYERAFVTDYENFILRRGAASGGASSPAFRLAFDARPLFLDKRYAKGKPLEGVVNPKCVKLNAGAVGVGKTAGSWRVTAPGPQWSYAASWPVATEKNMERPFLIEVKLRVSGAPVGFACVSSDYSTIKDAVTRVEPAQGVQTATIVVEDASGIGCLAIRNEDGVTAEAEVLSIDAFLAEPGAPRRLSALLHPQTTRLSIAACDRVLRGADLEIASDSPQEPGIDVVPVEKIHRAFGFQRPFVPKIKIYWDELADFKTEIHETAIYSYIYEQAQPKRHLEFGTWEGFGATICARSCGAEIWTLNLSEGEKNEAGDPAYSETQAVPQEGSPDIGALTTENNRSTDSGALIGWRYRAAGFADRVHQILCDSRDFDTSPFGEGFFDTVLVDGGHTADVVTSDTNKALPLLRSGGIMIWHDFCPDPETIRQNESPCGVIKAIIANFDEWSAGFSKIFWIQPSWMLIGIKA